jgi:hypothetical protein
MLIERTIFDERKLISKRSYNRVIYPCGNLRRNVFCTWESLRVWTTLKRQVKYETWIRFCNNRSWCKVFSSDGLNGMRTGTVCKVSYENFYNKCEVIKSGMTKWVGNLAPLGQTKKYSETYRKDSLVDSLKTEDNIKMNRCEVGSDCVE